MALVAHPARNWPVHIVVENPFHVRAMGVMAVSAVGGRNRVIHVLLGENRPVGFMAPYT